MGCFHCNNGNVGEYIAAAQRGANHKGELFTAECSTKQKGYEINWEDKSGLWLGRKVKK
jgi:hypothetical protein